MAKTGRPSEYSIELATEICKRIALGESMLSITKDPKMPSHTSIYSWLLDEDKKEFLDKYESARAIQAEMMFEELVKIADTPEEGIETIEKGDLVEIKKGDMLGHRRLKVDTRKWYLSKVLPKKFGEKVDVTSGGEKIQSNAIVFADFKNPNAADSQPSV